jgi:hypothetical protein
MVDKEKVRLFMTNILDGHGNVIVMGEDSNSTDNIGIVELIRPMRLVLNEKGVIPATFFNSQEWVKLAVANVIEMNIHAKILELYQTYVQEVFGAGIIMPEEKQIILI